MDIFQTNDLSEKRDMGSVTNTMFALGRAVSMISSISNNENMSIILPTETLITSYFIFLDA